MKLRIDKQTLERHLENVTRALNNTTPLASLTGILISANESNIQLIASNGNLSIQEVVNFNANTSVEIAGKILVPGKLFKEIIKKQTNVITIEVEGKVINILSDKSKTSLNLLDVNEFPTISFDAIGKDLVIKASVLNSLIKNVSFAAGENDKRIILNGVNIVAKDGLLVATATNSFRLAQEKVGISSNVDFNITILSKNLKDFLPTTASGELLIKVEDNKIITSYESSTVVSKLIDGVYPDVSRLIPETYQVELNVDVREIIDLLDRATVIAEESSRVVRLTILGKELIIESRRNEVGDTSVGTQKFTANTESFAIAFNATFLKDAISKFSGMVKIGFNGEFKAFVVRSTSQPSMVQLVLPHRSF